MIDLQLVCAALFGAALVSVGVLASAAADRVRRGRADRRASRAADALGDSVENGKPYAQLATRRTKNVVDDPLPIPTRTPRPPPTRVAGSGLTSDADRDAVVAALVEAGYGKQAARDAVERCIGAERSGVEAWTASALRRIRGAP